jgi:hypothetical protein
MPVQARTLKVRANPWIGHDTINNLGFPVGRVMVEQPAGSFDPRLVGCRIKRAIKTSDAPKNAPLAQESHELEIEYDSEPVTVVNSDYYRRRVMKGELIAADRASFVAAGGRPKDFEEHQKHLDLQKTAAITEFNERNGEGAYEALCERHLGDEKRRAEVAAAVSEARGDAPPAGVVALDSKSTDVKKGESK